MRKKDIYRIVHLTDAHVSGLTPAIIPKCFNKRIIGVANIILRRQHQYSQEIFKTACWDICQQEADHLVFSGDLTSIGTREEMEKARKIFQPLKQKFGPHISMVQGNHDLYVKECVKQNWLERYFNLDNSSQVKVLNSHLALVTINSALPTSWLKSTGQVSDQQRGLVKNLLIANRELTGKKLIVVSHFHLEDPPDGQAHLFPHHLENRQQMIKFLFDAKVDYYLHGHLHHGYTYRLSPGDYPLDLTPLEAKSDEAIKKEAEQLKEIITLNPGSIARKHLDLTKTAAYNIYNFKAGKLQSIKRRVFLKEQNGFFDLSPRKMENYIEPIRDHLSG